MSEELTKKEPTNEDYPIKDPQYTLTLDGNKITLEIVFHDRYLAAQQHIGWKRAFRSGSLFKLIAKETWKYWL